MKKVTALLKLSGNIKGKLFCLSLFILFGFTGNRSSLTAYIAGSPNVTTGSEEYYEASFTVSPDPLSIIYWTVINGTIISQNIYPSNGVIYCIVEWSSTPGSGSI